MPSCNGLEILVPQHLWKSKIGPLQLILATKRYVTFFWVTLYLVFETVLFGRNSGPPPLVVSWRSLSRLAKGWRLFHRPSIAAQQALLQVVEWFLQLHDLAKIWGFTQYQMFYIYGNNRVFIKMTRLLPASWRAVDSGRVVWAWVFFGVDLCIYLTTDKKGKDTYHCCMTRMPRVVLVATLSL